MKVKVQVGDAEKELEIVRQGDDLRMVIDGRETIVHIVHQDGAHFVLEYGDPAGEHTRRRRLRAAGYAQGDQRQLWVNGSLVHYQRVREQVSAALPAGAGSLSASIPAIVSEILVRPGDDVAAGQKLILLESMKMVIPIQAPFDGTVSAVNCSAGEAVQPGNPLVELEAHE